MSSPNSLLEFVNRCLHEDSNPGPTDYESSDRFLNTNYRLDELTKNRIIYHLQSPLVGAAYRTVGLTRRVIRPEPTARHLGGPGGNRQPAVASARSLDSASASIEGAT